MSKKVLVTGATGFVGRHLVNKLLAVGQSVRVLTRDKSKALHLWGGSVDIVVGDLTDRDSLKSIAKDIDIVYHLAGEIKEKEKFYKVNVEGTKNLLQVCLGSEISKFVHFSSAGVTGPSAGKVVDERTPCNPISDYERSKYEGERIALDFWAKFGMPVTIVRPTIIFGEGRKRGADSFATWLTMIQKRRFWFIGSGDYVANYIYVGDVVEACMLIAKRSDAIGEVYIVSDPCTMREFVGTIADILDVKYPRMSIPRPLAYLIAANLQIISRIAGFSPLLTVNRVRALTNPTLYSAEKIRKELGFIPPLGFREGLRRTIQWYRDNGILLT
jgi:nucleoside-diphosphate-sugar epimerase